MGKLQELAVSSAPTFKCFIPSKGKTVKMRSFLVKEQKLLLMAKESDGDGIDAIVNAVTQLLQNCVLEDINITDHPSFDVEYMFVQLFMNSTASKQSVAHYQCKAHRKDDDGNELKDENDDPILCNEINKVSINLANAKVPADHIKSGVIEVNSKTIEKLVFKYPTFDQATTITQSMGENIDSMFRIYGDCLTAIYKVDGSTLVLGEDYDTDDAVEFLEYLSGDVFDKVKTFFEDLPTLTATAEFKCKKCGNETEIVLRGLDDFF